MKVRCEFHLRTPLDSEYTEDEGKATYEAIEVRGPQGDGCLHTEHPPAIGDLVFVWSDRREGHEPGPGVCRVLSRMWIHSAWGSANWPYGETESRVGPTCSVIIEQVDGIFADEAPRATEEA